MQTLFNRWRASLQAHFVLIFILSSSWQLLIAQQVVPIPSELVQVGSDIGVKEALRNAEYINSILRKHGNQRKILQLPPGSIVIGKPILLPSQTTLRGDKKGTVFIIHKNFESAQAYFLNENFNLGNASFDSAITLQYFGIDGSQHADSPTSIMGIFLNKVNEVSIQALNISQVRNEAIRIHCSVAGLVSRNIEIIDCNINKRDRKLQGIMISSFTTNGRNDADNPRGVEYFRIIRNTITGSDHGIMIFNAKNGLIEANRCLANFERGIILSPSVEKVKVKNNEVDSAGSTGIHLAFRAKNIEIIGNKVSNTLRDMSGKGFEGQGIKAYTGFEQIIITDNVCSNNATDGIALEGGGGGKDFLIANNVIRNNKRNGIRMLAGSLDVGISGNIANGSIEGNTIEGNSEDGIFIGSDDGGRGRVKSVQIKASNKINQLAGKRKVRLQFKDRTVTIPAQLK